MEKDSLKIPVLLTASMCQQHKIRSIETKFCQPQTTAAYMVRNIASNSGATHHLLETKVEYNPNFTAKASNPYIKKIKKIITDNKIELFIDIREMPVNIDVDFMLQYEKRYRKSGDIAFELTRKLATKKLRDSIFSVQYLPAGDRTICSYVAKSLKIPSIQISVSEYICDDDELLEEFISTFSRQLYLCV